MIMFQHDIKPTFAGVAKKIDELTGQVTKVRISKLELHAQVDVVDDMNAPKMSAHVTTYNQGDVIEKEYYSEAPVWMAKVERPSYLASDIKKPTDIAWLLPKGEYVVAKQSFDHISSMEEFKKGEKTLYMSLNEKQAKRVPAEKIADTIVAANSGRGDSREL